ncbi:hypothetical protein O1611_g4074 [Lasiodiplodia mahajangana]|uniref:Uncharacterized protein n=1 Tax=Lasiodiplodia mahajangana TaxID=1108764 RepID=A0ACC2JQG2_9PEZI|nr:hypothetical protein O1611_g4074 [Lasiodiplodia mahajangana]
MSDKVTASDGGRRLRRLLPATVDPPEATATATKQSSRHSARLQPRKTLIPAACSTCRRLKVKCSGDRPSCRRCATRRIQCHYVTQPGETSGQALKRKYDELGDRAAAHEEMFDLLRTLPEQDAQNVLQRIRSGTDIVSIIDHVRAGNLLLELTVAPETRFRYQFPYRSEMPADCLLNNNYLDSMIYEGASLLSQSDRPGLPARLADYQSPYLKPFHAAEVVEPLLSDVRPSLWTSVCDDDTLMRDLLRVFFRCEYHFTSSFQKDYFLEDMAAQRKEFCSPLLVCYPRFTDRAEYWNPHTLSYRFLAEAKRIWELECAKPKITTIQAGVLFNVFHNLCGLDEIGQPYRIQAITLAHNLRLFEKSTECTETERERNGKVYTAWMLLVGFSFMIQPLLKKPPGEPLPDPSESSLWYGEIWLRYPLSESLCPSYFGHVFRAKSHFRVIMNDFCHAAYSKDSNVTLHKANSLRSQLREWYDGLPGPLQPKAIVLPGQLQLHMYYHNLTLSIYKPLLGAETDQEPHPQQIVADAAKYLQTLVRLYYLRHGFDAMDLYIVIPLVHAGFECINAINNETPAAELEVLRSTLILVAQGLHSQRHNHYLAEALFRVIRGRMRSQEVSLLRKTTTFNDAELEKREAVIHNVRSHWPVGVVKKEEMDDHILGNLVETYALLKVDGQSEAETEGGFSKVHDYEGTREAKDTTNYPR